MSPACWSSRPRRRSISPMRSASAPASWPRIAAAPPPVKLLVIEASGIIDIDYTGSQLLQQTIAELRERGIEVAIARLSDEGAQEQAVRTGLIEAIGPGRVFRSVEEAVRRIGPDAKLSPGWRRSE